MGHGNYSFSSRSVRASSLGYHTKSRDDIFTQRTIHKEMDPNGVTLRESRDSEEHPNSFPFVLGLDETGSMGTIPHDLVRDGLPHIMQKIIDKGIPDPQILFLGIGDHLCDYHPLQIGQFESSDELLDKWLTSLYLEGHGGGNRGESYLLAWFFAGRYTETDNMDKRGKKGILITIGDEAVHNKLSANDQKRLMGGGEYSSLTAVECLESARKKYEVYHLHMLEGQEGRQKYVKDCWKELMGDNCIYIESRSRVPDIIADLVVKVAGNGVVNTPIHESRKKAKVEEML